MANNTIFLLSHLSGFPGSVILKSSICYLFFNSGLNFSNDICLVLQNFYICILLIIMRFIYTLLFTLLLGSFCAAQDAGTPCPPEGSTPSDIGKRVNILKNRDIVMGTANPNITIDTILKGMPEDTGRFKSTEYVTITGFVLGDDDEGPESCNCFSKDSSKHNSVLYIGHSSEAGKDSVFAVEITAKYKAAHKGFNADLLFGHKITVSGYIMYNFDMKKYALNACRKCRTTDRKTAWEICPVTEVIVPH